MVEPVLHDHLVNNVSANNTSPPEKLLTVAVELFVGHDTATPLTLHFSYLLPHGISEPFSHCRSIFAKREREVNKVNPVF